MFALRLKWIPDVYKTTEVKLFYLQHFYSMKIHMPRALIRVEKRNIVLNE